MAIESKDLLVSIKSYSRAEPLPLDASEVYDSIAEAEKYADSPIAYAGQTIKVLQNGLYISYILNPANDDSGKKLVLSKVGISESEVKNYVQIVTALPQDDQEQGIIYVNITDNKGYIYTGSEYKVIFEQIDGLQDKIQKLDNIYTKEETDAEIQKAINDTGHLTREIVDSLPEIAEAKENVIYMIPKENGSETQYYTEYIFVNGSFEEIGDTSVDLTDYAKKTEVEEVKAYIDSKIENVNDTIDAINLNLNKKLDIDKVGIDFDEITTTIKAYIDSQDKSTEKSFESRIGEIEENKTIKQYIDEQNQKNAIVITEFE